MDFSNSPNPYEDISSRYKVIVVGNSGVGKTTLIYRIFHNEYIETAESTLGVTSTQVVHRYNDQEIQFDLYDTAGQEQYRSLAPFYIKGSSISLICFDPRDEYWIESFNEWKSTVIEKDPNIFIIAVGTKYDLWNDKLNLFTLKSDVINKCNVDDVLFVSSLNGENVYLLLDEMAKKCLRGPEPTTNGLPKLEDNPKRKCCF